MSIKRTIPIILFDGSGLVKTQKFKNPTYVGDILNTIRIFNEKKVDELIILDISETAKKNGPNFEVLKNVASECFMPITYGGGIRNICDCRNIFKFGFEKISFNTAAIGNPQLVSEAVNCFGRQSIVCSIDAYQSRFKRSWMVRYPKTRKGAGIRLDEHLKNVQHIGAGEIVITSVKNEGSMLGYDKELCEFVRDKVHVPTIINGGAGSLHDLDSAFQYGFTGAGAGSMFVFQGPLRGVLISYPTEFVDNKWNEDVVRK